MESLQISTDYEKFAWFEDLFIAELDSWFTADIACCENCFSDFTKLWSLALKRDDAEWLEAGIDLDSFYEGSRLRDHYSKAEYAYLKEELECPWCLTSLGNIFHPYNLPFELDQLISSSIGEIQKLAKKTPFLLLQHTSCEKILKRIREISLVTKRSTFETHLYRARSGNVSLNIKEFEKPPAKIVGEQRYNHAGNPALYLGSSSEVCIAELGGSDCTIAKFKISNELKVLDLHSPDESHPDFENFLSTLVYSELLSAKRVSEDKKEYVFSRFIADCAKQAGFDAIQYPSTRLNHLNEYNLVILDEGFALAETAKELEIFFTLKDYA